MVESLKKDHLFLNTGLTSLISTHKSAKPVLMVDVQHDHYGEPHDHSVQISTKTVDELILAQDLYRLMENDVHNPCLTSRRIIVACDHCAPITY